MKFVCCPEKSHKTVKLNNMKWTCSYIYIQTHIIVLYSCLILYVFKQNISAKYVTVDMKSDISLSQFVDHVKLYIYRSMT